MRAQRPPRGQRHWPLPGAEGHRCLPSAVHCHGTQPSSRGTRPALPASPLRCQPPPPLPRHPWPLPPETLPALVPRPSRPVRSQGSGATLVPVPWHCREVTAAPAAVLGLCTRKTLEGWGQGSYPGVLSPGDVLTGCLMTDCPMACLGLDVSECEACAVGSLVPVGHLLEACKGAGIWGAVSLRGR